MSRKQKGFLPESSRKLLGNLLLFLISVLILFGLGFLIAGVILKLEPGDSDPVQYFAGVCAASGSILAVLLKKLSGEKNRVILVFVWAGAIAGAAFLLHTVVSLF